ncbi:MAG: type II toxin-antitoxin system RelE/ParE family toxin [Neisseria sp.]|nr:type II toxin-antitoxin system RelE/ParE family toxin [Neisseria sp.]
MIKSFQHKGLEKFFTTGSKAGIQAAHAAKLNILLTSLHAAADAAQMDMPGWNLHPLTGNLKGHYSVKVNGNWRLTFRFDGNDAEIVDYQDYH